MTGFRSFRFLVIPLNLWMCSSGILKNYGWESFWVCFRPSRWTMSWTYFRNSTLMTNDARSTCISHRRFSSWDSTNTTLWSFPPNMFQLANSPSMLLMTALSTFKYPWFPVMARSQKTCHFLRVRLSLLSYSNCVPNVSQWFTCGIAI